MKYKLKFSAEDEIIGLAFAQTWASVAYYYDLESKYIYCGDKNNYFINWL